MYYEFKHDHFIIKIYFEYYYLATFFDLRVVTRMCFIYVPHELCWAYSDISQPVFLSNQKFRREIGYNKSYN